VRSKVGRIGLVGSGWDSPAPWINPMLGSEAYYTDPEYLRRMAVEVSPAVHFQEVIASMGRGVFMPVMYRSTSCTGPSATPASSAAFAATSRKSTPMRLGCGKWSGNELKG
jgi:hypothetical protein